MALNELPLALTPASQKIPLLVPKAPGWRAWLPRLVLGLVVPGAPFMQLSELADRNQGYPRGNPWYISWVSGAVGFLVAVLAFHYWEWGSLTPLTLIGLNFFGSTLLFPASAIIMLVITMVVVLGVDFWNWLSKRAQGLQD